MDNADNKPKEDSSEQTDRTLEAAEFFAHRAASSKAKGLMPFLLNAPDVPE